MDIILEAIREPSDILERIVVNLRAREFIRIFLPRSIRPYRILTGALRGRIIFTSLHDYPGAVRGTTESKLVSWLRKNIQPGEIWFDIGAHYGYISLVMSLSTGPGGRIYAFEPMITTAGYLNLTRQANHLTQLTIISIALSGVRKPGLFQLPVTRGMADSTLDQCSDTETLLQFSLDQLREGLDLNGEVVAGVKIDVQGMEMDVLIGMQALLKTDHPKVLLEFHRGVNRSEITRLLAECGYKLPGRPLVDILAGDNVDYEDDQTYLFLPADQDEPS